MFIISRNFLRRVGFALECIQFCSPHPKSLSQSGGREGGSPPPPLFGWPVACVAEDIGRAKQGLGDEGRLAKLGCTLALGFCGFILATVEFPRCPMPRTLFNIAMAPRPLLIHPGWPRPRTPRNLVGKNNPTYYIRFSFPAAAEEPLDKVIISLDEGRRDPVFSYQL